MSKQVDDIGDGSMVYVMISAIVGAASVLGLAVVAVVVVCRARKRGGVDHYDLKKENQVLKIDWKQYQLFLLMYLGFRSKSIPKINCNS